jgi:ribosomal protein S18 acetylase RimI-like enzyme
VVWETGTVTFDNPLVLAFNTGAGHYDENSWKAHLADYYHGLTGLGLTRALLSDGYDGIVTVETVRGQSYTSEIVDLCPAKNPGLPCRIVSVSEDGDLEELEEVTDRDFYDVLDDVERLFRDTDIRIASYEQFHEACIGPNGEILGASVAGLIPGSTHGLPAVRFSVAVREDARRKGIARALIQRIIEQYPSGEFVLDVWVVNPYMAVLLEQLGFETEGGEWSQDSPMMYRYNPEHPWLSLRQVDRWIPLMEERGVSEVARKGGSSATGEGFIQAYRACGGRKSCMGSRMATKSTSWAQRRDGFIARHMKQVEESNEPLWELRRGEWQPTRRHLALIAWAYSPQLKPPSKNPPGMDAFVDKVSKETGVKKGIPLQVYKRGLAAWTSGHRPGTTSHQWARARVYSFVTGGRTTERADRKLAEEAGIVPGVGVKKRKKRKKKNPRTPKGRKVPKKYVEGISKRARREMLEEIDRFTGIHTPEAYETWSGDVDVEGSPWETTRSGYTKAYQERFAANPRTEERIRSLQREVALGDREAAKALHHELRRLARAGDKWAEGELRSFRGHYCRPTWFEAAQRAGAVWSGEPPTGRAKIGRPMSKDEAVLNRIPVPPYFTQEMVDEWFDPEAGGFGARRGSERLRAAIARWKEGERRLAAERKSRYFCNPYQGGVGRFSNWHLWGDDYQDKYVLYAFRPGFEHADEPSPESVVGFARYTIPKGARVVEVSLIHVDEGARRRGVGTALWRELERLWPGCEFPRGLLSPAGKALREAVGRNPPSFVVRSPAQGLRAIQHPDITANWKKALKWKPEHKKAVLVPCAGTKPFPEAPSHKHGYLEALNGKKLDVWVVSEPLGVVPYEWSEKYPQDDYDFPPEYLRGPARDELVDRIAAWFCEVAPKYKKVYLALPAHHRRLVLHALEQLDYPPTKIEDVGIEACLKSGGCPPGHVRPTTEAYRGFLKAKANPARRKGPPRWDSPEGIAKRRQAMLSYLLVRAMMYVSEIGRYLEPQHVRERELQESARADVAAVLQGVWELPQDVFLPEPGTERERAYLYLEAESVGRNPTRREFLLSIIQNGVDHIAWVETLFPPGPDRSLLEDARSKLVDLLAMASGLSFPQFGEGL